MARYLLGAGYASLFFHYKCGYRILEKEPFDWSEYRNSIFKVKSRDPSVDSHDVDWTSFEIVKFKTLYPEYANQTISSVLELKVLKLKRNFTELSDTPITSEKEYEAAVDSLFTRENTRKHGGIHKLLSLINLEPISYLEAVNCIYEEYINEATSKSWKLFIRSVMAGMHEVKVHLPEDAISDKIQKYDFSLDTIKQNFALWITKFISELDKKQNPDTSFFTSTYSVDAKELKVSLLLILEKVKSNEYSIYTARQHAYNKICLTFTKYGMDVDKLLEAAGSANSNESVKIQQSRP